MQKKTPPFVCKVKISASALGDVRCFSETQQRNYFIFTMWRCENACVASYLVSSLRSLVANSNVERLLVPLDQVVAFFLCVGGQLIALRTARRGNSWEESPDGDGSVVASASADGAVGLWRWQAGVGRPSSKRFPKQGPRWPTLPYMLSSVTPHPISPDL